MTSITPAEEDAALESIANDRDSQHVQYVSHAAAWGSLDIPGNMNTDNNDVTAD